MTEETRKEGHINSFSAEKQMNERVDQQINGRRKNFGKKSWMNEKLNTGKKEPRWEGGSAGWDEGEHEENTI